MVVGIIAVVVVVALRVSLVLPIGTVLGLSKLKMRSRPSRLSVVAMVMIGTRGGGRGGIAVRLGMT